MKRLTDPRLAMPPGEWREVTLEERKKLQEIPVPPVTDLYYRLASIEDILGDEYELEDLKKAIFDIILKEPAANVVEPVHCSQCAHHEENGYHWCNKWEHILPDDSDFFCKWGRKKEAADVN